MKKNRRVLKSGLLVAGLAMIIGGIFIIKDKKEENKNIEAYRFEI